MARKDWDSLSDSYRKRLERGGITKTAYDSGASLSAARGHAATPERPSRVNAAKPEHQSYIFRRDALIAEIMAAKRWEWEDRPKWNEKNAKKAVTHTPKGKERSLASLKRVAKAVKIAGSGDLWNAVNDMDLEDDDISALFYH